MTGATVVIKKEDAYILGKVRMDGFNVCDFFTPSVFNIPFEDLWQCYLEWRRRDWDQELLSAEIETQFDGGFSALVCVDAKEPGQLFNEVVEKMEAEIKAQLPDDGYRCGYQDYLILVDYDQRKIYDQHTIAPSFQGVETKEKEKVRVEIYLADLSEEKQKEVLEAYGVKTGDEMNADVYPIAIVEV